MRKLTERPLDRRRRDSSERRHIADECDDFFFNGLKTEEKCKAICPQHTLLQQSSMACPGEAIFFQNLF